MPNLTARMEQRDALSRQWILGICSIGLELIARSATQADVFKRSEASPHTRLDVIVRERNTAVCFAYAAVATHTSIGGVNPRAKVCRDSDPHRLRSEQRSRPPSPPKQRCGVRLSQHQAVVSLPHLCELAPFFLAQLAVGMSL